MATSSKRWLNAQLRDPYVKQARKSQYRSRAVYKLLEIDEKDKLFYQGQTVVDLGASPGGWSQYVIGRIGTQGKLISVDILPMEKLDNVLFIKGDFTETTVYEACINNLANGKADLVISDMSPNLTGIRNTDQARSMYLAELVFEFSCRVLQPGGSILLKLFQGQGADTFKSEIMDKFHRVVVRKPKASRHRSREFYILATGYKV